METPVHKEMTAVVVGIRFSILSSLPNWKVARGEFEAYRDQLFDEARLAYRFRLFENVTLPSLCDLRVPPVMRLHVVIITSTHLPEWARQRLATATASLSSVKIVAVDVDGPNVRDVLDRESRAFVQDHGWRNEKVVCATVRLDDDDALDAGYLEALRPFAFPKFAGMAVSFARGYAAEFDARKSVRLLSLHHLYQPKIALGLAYFNLTNAQASQWEQPRQRTVYDLGAHNAIDAVVPTILVSDAPRYIRTIHGHNDDRMDGWHYSLARCAPSSLRGSFDGVLANCEVLAPEESDDFPTARELFRNSDPHRAVNRMQKKQIKKLKTKLRRADSAGSWLGRLLSRKRKQHA